jgi:hypothetical protein
LTSDLRHRKIEDKRDELKVGLVWSSGQGPLTEKKSVPLKLFSKLAKLDRLTFYSLQIGHGAIQAKDPPEGLKFVDLTEEINDFSDTAALIENLDLVISVDTAVAHLAGALGKSVWTLLDFLSDWRWLRNREDTPWYPTMRLFRQPSPGDWESVIAKVRNELLKLSNRN